MVQLDRRNLECRVIVAHDQDVPLRDLLPKHWLDSRREPRGSTAQPRR
jgi:hypothetical protein